MKKRSQLAANGVNRTRTIMAGRGRTPLTPQQVDAIKGMVANKKSNGAIATPLGLKERTVAYVTAIA